jgi:hypothetical protein
MPRRPNSARITDGTNDPLGLHKPGWRVAATHDVSDPLPRYGVTDADRKAVADARAEYLHNLQDAWKTPATDARRKVQARNAKGQETGTFEKEEDNSDDITGAGERGPKRRKRGDPGVIGAGVQEWKGELEPEEEDEDGKELEDAACPRSRRAPADAESIRQMMRDHEARMEQEYLASDRALTEAWRGNGGNKVKQ